MITALRNKFIEIKDTNIQRKIMYQKLKLIWEMKTKYLKNYKQILYKISTQTQK